MTGVEWINIAVQAVVLLMAVWIIKADGKRIGDKIESMLTKISAIEISLHDCIKWSDLDKELGPVRRDVKDQDRRLTIMETECKSRHKGE